MASCVAYCTGVLRKSPLTARTASGGRSGTRASSWARCVRKKVGEEDLGEVERSAPSGSMDPRDGGPMEDVGGKRNMGSHHCRRVGDRRARCVHSNMKLGDSSSPPPGGNPHTGFPESFCSAPAASFTFGLAPISCFLLWQELHFPADPGSGSRPFWSLFVWPDS